MDDDLATLTAEALVYVGDLDWGRGRWCR